jgi:hypothetical protein
MLHDDRKRWPGVQRHPSPHGCARITDDLQIQTQGRRKDNTSPSSTYVHQCFLPSSKEVPTEASVVIGYVYENFIRERVDCYVLYAVSLKMITDERSTETRLKFVPGHFLVIYETGSHGSPSNLQRSHRYESMAQAYGEGEVKFRVMMLERR